MIAGVCRAVDEPFQHPSDKRNPLLGKLEPHTNTHTHIKANITIHLKNRLLGLVFLSKADSDLVLVGVNDIQDCIISVNHQM